MKLLRVLRGMIGTAVTWGGAWVPMSVGFYALTGLVPIRYWPSIAVSGFVRGALCGAAFAAILALVARRRSFSQLTFAQLMGCGAAGAVIAPGITFAFMLPGSSFSIPPLAIGFNLAMSGVMGVVSAAGTLYAARRAPELAAAEMKSVEGTPMPQAIR